MDRCRTDQAADSTNNNAETAASLGADPRHIDKGRALKQQDKARTGLGLQDDDVASGKVVKQ